MRREFYKKELDLKKKKSVLYDESIALWRDAKNEKIIQFLFLSKNEISIFQVV